VIQWNEKLGLPQKCTLCAHLLDEGWEKTRCVQACPTGALTMRHVEENETSRIVEEEKLEPFRPELKTEPRVLYKNLHRFTRAFIAGSIAVRVADRDECAEGAKVTLLNAANEVIDESIADSFGDFKFDGLEEGSGQYTLRIDYAGRDTKTVEVRLEKSVNSGVIFL
jgi:hypothetical protein